SAALDAKRGRITITPPAFTPPSDVSAMDDVSRIRQRCYRRGGSINDDWHLITTREADTVVGGITTPGPIRPDSTNTANGAAFTDRDSDDAVAAAPGIPINHFRPVPTVDKLTGGPVEYQPVRALWGPLEGMLLACGDPNRPGHIYWSVPDQPDHWA